MYELKITVTKVLGTCTADPPMKPGDHFYVRNGDLSIPDGGYICAWAFQSLLPLITPKEREICEANDEDWMWRVHHVQCPDPKGRVVFKVERVRKLTPSELADPLANDRPGPDSTAEQAGRGGHVGSDPVLGAAESSTAATGRLKDLRVVVERVGGKCTSGMKPGDSFAMRDGRLYIPSGRHFCLYALHAALPLLPAKQRHLESWDWMADDHTIICPDPAGNVILRIGFERETK
jgi:uncharacterized repeat protein (TIGR04076 family)